MHAAAVVLHEGDEAPGLGLWGPGVPQGIDDADDPPHVRGQQQHPQHQDDGEALTDNLEAVPGGELHAREHAIDRPQNEHEHEHRDEGGVEQVQAGRGPADIFDGAEALAQEVLADGDRRPRDDHRGRERGERDDRCQEPEHG